MPRIKASKASLMKIWISDYGKDFTTDGDIVYCVLCEKDVPCDKKYQIDQHVKTSIHAANKNKQNKKGGRVQTLLTTSSKSTCKEKSDFSTDLCKALVCSNIPLKKLNNQYFRSFLKKYCINQTIPDESTIRKKYLDVIYSDVLNEIRQDIGDGRIWISADETIDKCGRYMIHLVCGKLDIVQTPVHLLACKSIEKVDHSTVARFVNDSLTQLWPDGNMYENVLIFVTDAAPYMIKAAASLEVFYPNMIHISCLAHGLHRLAEKIREIYAPVNDIISSVKKIFLKAPLRIKTYKEMYPSLPLPPQPVLTRWGTWLNAAIFYAQNLECIRNVVTTFDSPDSSAISSAKELLNNRSLQKNLSMIETHFNFLVPAITKLESNNLLLIDAVSEINTVQECISVIPESAGGGKITEKFNFILNKNSGFKDVKKINDFLNGEGEELPNKVEPTAAKYYKYCPVTSVDVERTFSAFKMILDDKRQNLTVENLEKYVVVYCNKNYSQ